MVTGPVLLTIARHRADIVFLDPPYELEREYTAALEALVGGAAGSDGCSAFRPAGRYRRKRAILQRMRVLKQGDNALSFFRPRPNQPDASAVYHPSMKYLIVLLVAPLYAQTVDQLEAHRSRSPAVQYQGKQAVRIDALPSAATASPSPS